MSHQDIIKHTMCFVKQKLEGVESGHDWWHIYRVRKMACRIGKSEKVDMLTVELGALLHDIADSKFHNGDEEIGPHTAKIFLESLRINQNIISHVTNIIKHISFKGGNYQSSWKSTELGVVQDADRLDAMGAIGVARTFSYGGFKGREIYNPQIKPNLHMTKEQYKHSTGTTINHFYEKLLLLKDLMNTTMGRQIAIHRHQYMEEFLEEFLEEWSGKY